MKNFLKLTLVGAVIGLLNGFFGSGGGSVAVPCLEKFASLPKKRAHATAVAVILPLSVVSCVVYFGDADWKIAAFVSAGGLLGGFLGAKFLKEISPRWLKIVFGSAMLVAGVRMIWK